MSVDSIGSLGAAPEVTPRSNGDAAEPRFVVGIGASAGGLESLEKLFRNLPSDTGMAFVVLQHLSPDFKSMMLELLGRDTSMSIQRVEDGMNVRANCVYLLPARKEMVISRGVLRLKEKVRDQGVTLPIDVFMTSLALDYRERSIAVVLSGSGSDGSVGVTEIAQQGGFVICESPQTAKFDGMPRSSIETGVVDWILAPEEIGNTLTQIAANPLGARKQRNDDMEIVADRLIGIDAIYELFRKSYKIDFSAYKDPTVMRRIGRRMAIVGVESIDRYAEQLSGNPKELDRLYGDLLIGVTQFFRDPSTFNALQQQFLVQQMADYENGKPFRAWVAGCASGEEAYSLAMIIDELLEQHLPASELKLFATDVHQKSIDFAGRGVFSAEQIKGVSAERLQKHFTFQDGSYHISAKIRKAIVFAPHNVLSDAPFTDLNLVSCRNLLIYFEHEAQTHALATFHYALNKGGIMVLGGSESPGELSDDFDRLDERNRIYRKRHSNRHPHRLRQWRSSGIHNDLLVAPRKNRSSFANGDSEKFLLQDHLINTFMPPSLLIDEHNSLIDSFGGAEKFLHVRSRQPSLNVLELMDDSLRVTLAGAIGRTLKESKPIRMKNVELTLESGRRLFNVTVTPVQGPRISGRHVMIVFEPLNLQPVHVEANQEASANQLESSHTHIRQLEDELRHSRENLQATIEELETSNEELQATNEELIASNEELQSTNEELHSVNEELYTVNVEHQHKIDELAELNQDMSHLLENTDVATVFLDRDLRIRRFTSRIERVFDFVEADIGRKLTSFSPKFGLPGLSDRLTKVITSGRTQEYETTADDGTSYLLRILPYKTGDRVEGVVLMLVDVSSLEVLRKRLRWMSAIVESTDDAIIGQDLAGVITSWNSGAEKLYGYKAGEAIGRHVSMMIPEERRAEVEEYRNSIAAGERLHTRDTIRIKQDGTPIHVSLTVSPVYDANEQLIGISKIARDVSDRIVMEEEIRDQALQREAFLATLSHELRNPLNAALNASRLIQDDRIDEKTRRHAATVVDRQLLMTRGLLADLLDLSRVTQGKINLHCKTLNLCELIDVVRETTLSETKSHRQEITWRIPSEPVYVNADETRLTQVQVNLIHNALKYSPEETDVIVELSSRQDSAVISVTDYGVGIPSDQLKSIFEPFVQIGETVNQSEGGLGIGLTLVQSLVDAHGGTVTAESAGAGKGTTFRVILPITDPSQKASGESADDTTESPVRPCEIVLVEDIQDSREMLFALLSVEGHTVHAFGDGETGSEEIQRRCPQFALVDIGLPGIDGYDVARAVRANPACAETKLIALTGFGQPNDVDAALEAGFDAHLVKPIDPKQLTRMLK